MSIAHGNQNYICINRGFSAVDTLELAGSSPFNLVNLYWLNLALAVKLKGIGWEQTGTAFLMRAGGSLDASPVRPGHGDIHTFRQFLMVVKLSYRLSPLSDGDTDTVWGGFTTADNHNILAVNIDRIYTVTVILTVLGNQKIKGEMNSLKLTARDLQITRSLWTRS